MSDREPGAQIIPEGTGPHDLQVPADQEGESTPSVPPPGSAKPGKQREPEPSSFGQNPPPAPNPARN